MKNEPVSIDHLNFTVNNFEESVSWYSAVFGFEKVEEGIEKSGPWGVLRAGDTMLCIYENSSKTDIRSSKEAELLHHIFHFGLRIRNREKWERTVVEQNIKVLYGGAYRYRHSTSWYIKDPTGHMIEVAYWDKDEVKFI